METFSALLAVCAGNSRITGEFPAQRPVARSFDIFFDRVAGDSRSYRVHYDVIVMIFYMDSTKNHQICQTFNNNEIISNINFIKRNANWKPNQTRVTLCPSNQYCYTEIS